MDNERNEDLNPHGEDIDEKIRRMLDPSVPDDAGEAKKAVTPMAPKKSIVVKADEPALPVDGATEATPSAPELPKPTKATKDDKAITEKPGKKVAIPIDHQDAETTPPVEASTSDGAPPIKQITIDDANATPADVAEKLNETIAELGPTESDEAAPAAVETADAATSLTDDGSKEADVPVKDPAVLTDPATDKAVEEIVAAESDEILEVEDAVRDSDEQPTEAKPRHRLRAAFKALWHNRLVRWLFILLVVGGLIAAGTVPTSRYFLLNTAGVRASSSITILDDSTKQPLKNVHVSLGGATAVTDAEGNATVKQAKLGPTILTIEKSA
ncbi:MAG TPA: hypothetical protein VLF87_03405, partial [Patescibacteria group bacterium]|nr:hypothetical protein [Patescibacteria group bacterium]